MSEIDTVEHRIEVKSLPAMKWLESASHQSSHPGKLTSNEAACQSNLGSTSPAQLDMMNNNYHFALQPDEPSSSQKIDADLLSNDNNKASESENKSDE